MLNDKEKKTMRAYLAGKITGDSGYLDKFNQAEDMVKKTLNVEVINPACLRLPESCKWDDYMRITIEMLSMADAIVLLPDWRESPGACVEYGYALAQNKYILQYNEIIKRKILDEISPRKEDAPATSVMTQTDTAEKIPPPP